ncbi:hypothetical protein HJC99_04040 [Candidatus Saccharibacteria bacterium]|nr:hypothetical protein [Candidatus Saccharibacteria bacterium]
MVIRPSWRQFAQGMGALALALVLPGVAMASLSQGYNSAGAIATGSLVALDQKAGTVVAADTTTADQLFGVAVAPGSVSLSLGNTGNQVQVVTTGSANVLVSTEGGKIAVGDVITVSSISGVGQKSPSGKHRIIGTAQADFDGTGADSTKATIKDSSGASKEVSIGQIPVVIAVADYTTNAGGQDYQLPSWLQNFSNQVAGKTVAPIRIVVAGLILLVTLVSVTVLLYAAVRNSIISIGRNPLSRSSVLRGLLVVITIVLGLLAVATGAMYLVIAR